MKVSRDTLDNRLIYSIDQRSVLGLLLALAVLVLVDRLLLALVLLELVVIAIYSPSVVGSGVVLSHGLRIVNPLGNSLIASSFETVGRTTASLPFCQSAGVAIL